MRAILAIFCAALLLALPAFAQGRITPGKGGGGGVSLQSAFPGTPQAGNANINGSLSFNVTCQTQFCGGQYIKTSGTGLQFFPADFNTGLTGSRASQYSFFGPQGNSPLLDMKWLRGGSSGELQVTIAGCDITNPCITTNSGGVNSPLYLAGSTGVGQNRVVTTTSGVNATSGNLFEVTNNGVTEASIAFNGALTTAVPVPQASGGTGAGALTCAAGSFITSNGTAYSCASGSTSYFTFNTGVQSLASVNGSSCNTFAIVTTLVGSTAGFGCVATASPALGTTPLTLSCEMTGGTQANLRICNTGVNVVSPPASTTYYIRVFP